MLAEGIEIDDALLVLIPAAGVVVQHRPAGGADLLLQTRELGDRLVVLGRVVGAHRLRHLGEQIWIAEVEEGAPCQFGVSKHGMGDLERRQ